MLLKENFDKIIGSKYYWMYVDRDFDYNDALVQAKSDEQIEAAKKELEIKN